MKLLDFEGGINVTLGLPIVRATSSSVAANHTLIAKSIHYSDHMRAGP